MRFGSASITVTGTASPASVKTRVIPALRPTRPTVLVALIVMSSSSSSSRQLRLAGAAIQIVAGDGERVRARALESSTGLRLQNQALEALSGPTERREPADLPFRPLERYPVRARPRRKG